MKGSDPFTAFRRAAMRVFADPPRVTVAVAYPQQQRHDHAKEAEPHEAILHAQTNHLCTKPAKGIDGCDDDEIILEMFLVSTKLPTPKSNSQSPKPNDIGNWELEVGG